MVAAAGPAGHAAGGEEEILRLADPRGDDHGAGALVYPLRDDLEPGSLDLLELSARAVEDATEFTATFARAIASPAGRVAGPAATPMESIARLGFYTFNLDLYLDLDRAAGSGETQMLPGRGAEIDSAWAWERVVCLTPRPQEARKELRRRLLAAARARRTLEAGRVDSAEEDSIAAAVDALLTRRYCLPTRARVRGRTLTFEVPASFWATAPGEVENGDGGQPAWGLTAVVTGADPTERLDLSLAIGRAGRSDRGLFTMAVTERISPESFGGIPKGDSLYPAVIDLLQPAEDQQERELRGYDLRNGRRARVTGVAVPPMVRPGP